MAAGWVVAAAATIVNVLNCTASDQPSVVARATPPAWPVSPYYSYWNDGEQLYNPIIFAPKPELAIAYVNQGERVIKEIAFGLFVDEKLVVKVRDAGRFAPNVRIKHELRLQQEVFPLPEGTVHCVPLEITFEDGSKVSYSKTLRKSRNSDAR